MMDLKTDSFFNLITAAHSSFFQSATYPWETLNQLRDYINSLTLGEIEVDVSKEAYLINPEKISIGPGTVVEPGAYIQGPCVIGANCTIRHGAYLRGDVLVGNDCVIGHATEVKHSIFLDGAKAAHFAYVGDSILGSNSNLGAGTRCANLRLDDEEVAVWIDNQKVLTGRRKLGAIIGDGAQTGCNAVCNPGTFIAPKEWVLPCSVSSGFIKSRKKSTSSSEQD